MAKLLEVKLTFVEDVLGVAPGNPEIYSDYIASKAPEAKIKQQEIDELGALGMEEKRTMIFLKDESGRPFVYDYTIKGMLKDSCGMLRRIKDTKSSKLTSYKKVIDGLIFPAPRKIYLQPKEGDKIVEIESCQRPLRASTPMGDRNALAISESAPAGTWMKFNILCMQDNLVPLVKECLMYGCLHGFGGWRNSGKGRFDVEFLSEEDASLEYVFKHGMKTISKVD